MDANHREEKLRKIKLLLMDVDGTLTDSGVYYSRNGEELKRFSIRDGMGIELLHLGGIASGIVTTEESQIAAARGARLKIKHIVLGCRNKKAAVMELSSKLSIAPEEIAFIGDDVNDIHAMQVCGIGACPSDSSQSVIAQADIVCTRPGGNGAVRELCEMILQSQNKSVTLPENW